jgi:galactokinase
VSKRWFRSPGRVNLIGDHTDYNDGFVLPIAIDLECRIGSRPGGDAVRVRSREGEGEIVLGADGSGDPGPGWGRYVAGVLRALAERGRPQVAFDGSVCSSIPIGAGLSSSAAFEVAIALAASSAAGFELPPVELALACQEAEHLATGVPCGIMDQLAAIAGRRDAALLIDCRSLSVEPVPLPPSLAVLVFHSGLSRSLADSAYAERRAACEVAAARLGLRALRDATADQVADDPRARHVVSENERVLAAAAALRDGDVYALGRLLSESHVSLRDDFEVSTPQLDALVEALTASGALGARLTGAGFGGCVVALALGKDAARVSADACERYRRLTGLEPTPFRVRAVAGAGSARRPPPASATACFGRDCPS